MKTFIFLCILVFSVSMCTDKKKKGPEKMIPVETDSGIGDGAPSLDSLLQESNDSLK